MSAWDSEWTKQSGWYRRAYAPDLVGEVQVMGGPWFWTLGTHLDDEHRGVASSDGHSTGELAEVQSQCDSAALAYIFVALAKRAAAWADGIDAALARRYRAAVLAHRTATRAWLDRVEGAELEYRRAGRLAISTHNALVRGWL